MDNSVNRGYKGRIRTLLLLFCLVFVFGTMFLMKLKLNSYTQRKGKRAEDIVVFFLRKKGFFVLERNYFVPNLGEIDILAEKDNVLHLIEVKSGVLFDKKDFYNPAENFHVKKYQRIYNTGRFFIKEMRGNNKEWSKFQIDLYIVFHEKQTGRFLIKRILDIPLPS